MSFCTNERGWRRAASWRALASAACEAAAATRPPPLNDDDPVSVTTTDCWKLPFSYKLFCNIFRR